MRLAVQLEVVGSDHAKVDVVVASIQDLKQEYVNDHDSGDVCMHWHIHMMDSFSLQRNVVMGARLDDIQWTHLPGNPGAFRCHSRPRQCHGRDRTPRQPQCSS